MSERVTAQIIVLGYWTFGVFFRFERFLTAKWASFAPLLMMFDEESKWKSHRSSEKEDFEKIAQPQEQLTQSFFPICMSSGINYRRQRRPTRSFPESAIKPERHPPKIGIEDLWELFCVSGHIENESKISWRFLYDTDQHDELHTLNKQAVNEGKVFMAQHLCSLCFWDLRGSSNWKEMLVYCAICLLFYSLSLVASLSPHLHRKRTL